MKASDLKVVAIILAIALFFTIVTSNAVSIASVVILAKGGVGTTASAPTANNGTTSTDNGNQSTDIGTQTPVDNGNTATPTDNGSTDTPATPTDNGNSSTPATPADNGSSSSSSSSSGNGNSSTPADNKGNNSSGNNSNANANNWDKAKVFDFYKTAAHNMATKGNAGYTKVEYQALSNLNLTGMSFVDDKIVELAGNYMTDAATAKADPQISEKNSDKAKSRFPDCTLTDLSKVVSATKQDLPNGNYKITIIMVDEDTPKATGSVLGQVTNSVLYWEDIAAEVANISIISNYENTVSVFYKGYKIEAEMTKDGKFVSLGHFAGVDITINGAKILGVTLNNKSAHLDNTCEYYDFKY